MGQYSKYKLYYKEEYDGEQWTPVIPYQYYGEMIEEYSTDCGYVPPTRTIVDYDSDCSGRTKVTTATTNYQISYDNGQTWVTTSSTSSVTYEYNSEDCIASDYLTFIAKSSGVLKFSGGTTNSKLSYSTDSGSTWSSPSRSVTVNVNSQDRVMFKGNISSYSSIYGMGYFSASTASFDVEGNIMSLIYGDNFIGQTSLSGKYYVFKSLFASTNIINAEHLILPATTLEECCYQSMFSGCTNLIKAPQLPSTTLAARCYEGMFNGCSSLTQAPQLPAITLSPSCYYGMFANCINIVTAPELSATTLVYACYENMFNGCNALNYIKMLATTIASGNDGLYVLDNWVSGVASSGTFVKDASMTTLPTGDSGIPSGWTVQNV